MTLGFTGSQDKESKIVIKKQVNKKEGEIGKWHKSSHIKIDTVKVMHIHAENP